MALSGTLETFSLPDVLRLLASTHKTGLLALDGDRGHGRIWVDGGDIVAAEADRATHADVDGALFELLRFRDAAFEFDTRAELPDGAGAPRPVADALDLAEVRLAEWAEIEAVVPSLDVLARMVSEVDGDVTVSAPDWHLLARIGSGASGHDLAGHLGEGEYEVCRRLRDLVTAGLVEVDELDEVDEVDDVDEVDRADAPVGSTEPGLPEPVVVDAFEAMVHAPAPEVPVFDVAAAVDEQAHGREPVDPAPPGEPVAVDGEPWGPVGTDAPVGQPEPVAAADPGEQAEASPSSWASAEAELRSDADPADVLADLAHLSPRAAAAVEATWAADAPEASTDPSADAAEPGAEAPGEPAAGGTGTVDQDLLLRFLSSSKP